MKITPLLFLVPCVAFTAERPAEIVALVERARTVQAEFGADALIRLGTLGRVDPAWRIELLEEAFQLAGRAQEELRRRPANVEFEGQSGYLERASMLEIDRLSLRMRAVEALLPISPARARALFVQVEPPRLPALTCRDALAFDVSRYYDTLGKVLAGAFSAQPPGDEEPFQLVVRSIGVRHPAQLGPVARLLAIVKLTDAQFQVLLKAFTEGLRQVKSDDRSFSYARGAGLPLKRLVAAVQKRGASPVATLEAYRAYLVRHLVAVRCADNTRIGVRVSISMTSGELDDIQAASNAGGYFNDTLRLDPVKPLTVEEQLPARVEGEADGLSSCDTPECKALAERYRALIVGANQQPLNQDEKSTETWQASLREYLAALDQWKGEKAGEHFRLKATAYSDLLAAAPLGAGREMVVKAFVRYLEAARPSAERPVDWLLPVMRLVGRAGLDPVGFAKVGEMLKASGDAAISLYAHLEKVAPLTPDRILPLL